MTYDRRTGKPIASIVTKIAPEVVSFFLKCPQIFVKLPWKFSVIYFKASTFSLWTQLFLILNLNRVSQSNYFDNNLRNYYFQVLREERVIGSVTSEVTAGEAQGRITYENKGECFFLPFSKDDVEGNVTLRINDQVSFQIATNNK